MTASELIDAYVTAIATQLPRQQRDDVAFELRALLHEELQDKAQAAGRAADTEMASLLLRDFGQPADVAARYLPTLTIIDPQDGRRFLRATVIGLLVFWSLGAIEIFGQPIASGGQLLQLIGQWLLGTLVTSFWWPGVLVVCYGLAAWSRRRKPTTAGWLPPAGDRLRSHRGALLLAIFGILCGLAVLLDPTRILDVLSGGRAAPAAYQALSYSSDFTQRQGLLLLALLLLNVPLLLAVIVQGRWSPRLHQLNLGLVLLTCAAMTWAVLGGPIFRSAASDQFSKLILCLIIAFILVYQFVRWHRSVRPNPKVSRRSPS